MFLQPYVCMCTDACLSADLSSVVLFVFALILSVMYIIWPVNVNISLCVIVVNVCKAHWAQ